MLSQRLEQYRQRPWLPFHPGDMVRVKQGGAARPGDDFCRFIDGQPSTVLLSLLRRLKEHHLDVEE